MLNIYIITLNKVTNLPPHIVFDHCSSTVFHPFSPPSIQSVSHFKLIRKQKKSTVLAQYIKYIVFPSVFLRYNCLMVN